MPRGRQQGKSRGGREAAEEKKKERSVRQALRKERKAGAYLSPGDPDFRSFSNQLEAQGLRLQDVPGDGNCLFRALADQLGDRLLNHRALRKDIVRYMREHRVEFEPFVTEGSFEDYLSELSKDGVYAGNDVIVAFTRAYNTHVIIHQLNNPRWEIKAPQASATPTATPTVHIAYLNGEHYSSVKPGTPSHPLPPIQTPSQLEKGSPETACRRKEGGTDLQRVVEATGCQDLALAEKVLVENAFQPDLAIVELLQLMDLGQSGGGGMDGLPTLDETPTPAPHPSPSPPSLSTEKVSFSRSDGAAGRGSGGSKHTSKSSAKPQQHLSNRERKEQAKAARKQRRLEEQRAGARATEKAADYDPVGAMAI